MAWLEALPGSAAVLVAANLVPLVGVLLFGWSLATILVLYWAESGVVGLLNIPKILLARGDLRVGRGDVSLALPMLDGSGGLLLRLFLSVFFLVHYGIFWLAHGF